MEHNDIQDTDSIISVRIPQFYSKPVLEGSKVVIEYNINTDQIAFYDYKTGKETLYFDCLSDLTDYIFDEIILKHYYESTYCWARLIRLEKYPDIEVTRHDVLHFREYLKRVERIIYMMNNKSMPLYDSEPDVDFFIRWLMNRLCGLEYREYEYLVFSLPREPSLKGYFKSVFERQVYREPSW